MNGWQDTLGKRGRRWRVPSVAVVVASGAIVACDAPPVAWDDPQPSRVTAASPARLTLRNGTAAVEAAPVPITGPDTAGACRGSVRFAGTGARWFAVWWAPAKAGRATLSVSQSTDGGATWSAPIVADGRDAGTIGCERPAPAIARDAPGGYTHFAYWMAPSDGAGVFFMHYMDSDGLFHAPVAAVYGDRPAAVDVNASGDRVAVVYEDPNAPGGVGLALSKTAGHLFDHRERIVDAHSGARAPLVAVDGAEIAVVWKTNGQYAIRRGHIQR